MQPVHVNLFKARLLFQCVTETWAQDCIRLMKRPKFGTGGLCKYCTAVFFPTTADQLSPPWARATQLVQWYRSSGRRGRLHLNINRSLHFPFQTGVLFETFQAISATVRSATCNTFSSQYHAEAGFAKAGTAQFSHGQTGVLMETLQTRGL